MKRLQLSAAQVKQIKTNDVYNHAFKYYIKKKEDLQTIQQ